MKSLLQTLNESFVNESINITKDKKYSKILDKQKQLIEIWVDFVSGKNDEKETMSKIEKIEKDKFALDWWKEQFENEAPQTSSMGTFTALVDPDNVIYSLEIDEDDDDFEDAYEQLEEYLEKLEREYKRKLK